MALNPCPIRKTSERLAEILSSGRITQPRDRERMEMLLRLLDDISFGRAKQDHLQSMEAIAKLLVEEGPDKGCIEVGRMVSSTLGEHRYVFLSHIEAHYCPTGECSILSAAPCQLACPASVDVPSYVALVGMGRYREAMEVLLQDLPLPGTLGRVCVHPCEKACRRGQIDEPIAICQLKRVAFDKAYERGMDIPAATPQRFKEKVAIIGSGPAGLSTAYFLAKKGYRPTIFEALSLLGGMLRTGIPDYRLPRDVLDKEISHILRLGVETRIGQKLGTDFTLADLEAQGFEAIFLAIGAHRGMKANIPGEDKFEGVLDAVDFLRGVNLGDHKKVGDRILIIGGGNVAIDTARVAKRLGCQEVNIVYRRSREEMPAYPEEINGALEEGVEIHFLTAPVRVLGADGNVSGLECIKTRLREPDASGRRRPVPVTGSEFVFDCDGIIPAIGQRPDMDWLMEPSAFDLSRWGTLEVDPQTMQTKIPHIFAAGDMVTGPATVVEAVASGRKAAESIHHYLRKLPYYEHAHIPARRQRVAVMEITSEEKSLSTRPLIPELGLLERRGNFREVGLGLSGEAAREEAKRCLRCDICISCGRCIEVCRDEMGVDAIHLSYVEQHRTEDTDFLRPAEHCIGCGSCAVNCPTDAITVEEKNGERRIVMCGAEMSRHKLLTCALCGESFIPQKHMDYIHKRADDGRRVKFQRNLCPVCSKRARAETIAGQLII